MMTAELLARGGGEGCRTDGGDGGAVATGEVVRLKMNDEASKFDFQNDKGLLGGLPPYIAAENRAAALFANQNLSHVQYQLQVVKQQYGGTSLVQMFFHKTKTNEMKECGLKGVCTENLEAARKIIMGRSTRGMQGQILGKLFMCGFCEYLKHW